MMAISKAQGKHDEGELRMSSDQKFTAFGTFDEAMASVRMHVHDPNPLLALRARMTLIMLPALNEAVNAEVKLGTDSTQVVIAAQEVAVNFIVNTVRRAIGDESTPKAIRMMADHMKTQMRSAAREMEEDVRGKRAGGH
jgi:hypothetical protein